MQIALLADSEEPIASGRIMVSQSSSTSTTLKNINYVSSISCQVHLKSFVCDEDNTIWFHRLEKLTLSVWNAATNWYVIVVPINLGGTCMTIMYDDRAYWGIS